MAHGIPLIRAAVLFPMINWLNANGRSVHTHLAMADLGYVSSDMPELPVPLLSVLTFLRALGEAEGPDIAARIVMTSSLLDLGAFGRILLGMPTPRFALRRAMCILPRYSTHELLALRPFVGGLRVEAGWSLVLDEDAMLLTQQFTAALVHLLGAATGRSSAGIRRIGIAPHPVHGVEHLRKWLGNTLVPQPGPMLTIDLDDDMLDAPLPFDAAVAHDPAKPLAHNWGSLSGDASFGHSVRLVISAMANAPPVTVARVAHAAGMSDRTLQRTLRGEGASFRRLVDAVRCDRALRMLPTRADPLALLAHDAGYAAQSSLSRAVRRWTGQPPRAVRAASARNKPSA